MKKYFSSEEIINQIVPLKERFDYGDKMTKEEISKTLELREKLPINIEIEFLKNKI